VDGDGLGREGFKRENGLGRRWVGRRRWVGMENGLEEGERLERKMGFGEGEGLGREKVREGRCIGEGDECDQQATWPHPLSSLGVVNNRLMTIACL